MALGLSHRFRRPSRLLSLLVATMALVSQLALGAAVLPDDAAQVQLAALDAVSILCHTDGTTGGHGDAPTHHRGSGHALCPLDVSLALPSAALASAPHLPAPPLPLTLRARPLPPARAPPTPMLVAAYPRGPPSALA